MPCDGAKAQDITAKLARMVAMIDLLVALVENHTSIRSGLGISRKSKDWEAKTKPRS